MQMLMCRDLLLFLLFWFKINFQTVNKMLVIYVLILFTVSTHQVTAYLNNVTTIVQSKENNETLVEDKVTIERYPSGTILDEVAAVQFLKTHDKQASEECRKLVEAEWNYATNITEENKNTLLEKTLAYADFSKRSWKTATLFNWKKFQDPLIRRWFKQLSVLGSGVLSKDQLKELNGLMADMEKVYSSAKICPYTPDQCGQAKENCSLALEPHITRLLEKSYNYEELTHLWKAWRDATGRKIKSNYIKYLNLSNLVAKLNGFNDMSEMWRTVYESDTFRQDLETLWKQIEPLYKHLHAYVRFKLMEMYGTEKIKKNGPIPAHLLGNMWAQSWKKLHPILMPYKSKPKVDVTESLIKKNITVLRMFQISEEFFTSLGLKPMPPSFWNLSVIERPNDGREIVCHASAWDFCDRKDVRIKQCTDINMKDLITIHHEMGHIQYYLQYAHQPFVFREGANPGFHEAVGDALALSVSTPNHLKAIGLLDEVSNDYEGQINYLMSLALEKIAFLPSAYLMDLWRWDVFSGAVPTDQMNKKWWKYRLKYQGICPPVKRTDEDFDPGAKYHIPANVPYIRYFVSFVIQFQFHKALCEASGNTKPLHECDIYRSHSAGKLLSEVLSLGSSETWTNAMRIMTKGKTNKMDAGPLMEYFAPLLDWLKKELKDKELGWTASDPMLCPGHL